MNRERTIEEIYRESFPKSRDLYGDALEVFPNGVTHDYRFLQPYPIYIVSAQGSRKYDEDGNEYIDYWAGHGSLLLGHCYPPMVEAVSKQVAQGTHLGACHRLEVEWGKLVLDLIPSAERVRFVSSGTEATMMALRLSRIYTGRNKLIKFAGHFHGWSDPFMPGVNPPFDATIPGIPNGYHANTLVCPPNDIDALANILRTDGDIACVILEPTGASFGTIPTGGEFLADLREITEKHGVVLIFDEVITGFRVAPGGAQEYYGITPDLTALAKILAGGLPGGALTGKSEIMELLQIKDDTAWKLNKKMYHPGTYNANPLSAAAGIATLEALKDGQACRKANEMGEKLRRGLNDVIRSHGLTDWYVYGEFSGFRWLIKQGFDLRDKFADGVCKLKYYQLKGVNDPKLTTALRQALIVNGVDTMPSGGMTTAAHTDEDIEKTCEAFDRAIKMIKKDGLI